MSAPRDHHYIPVFYLKRWGLQNGKLVEYSIKHSKFLKKCVGPRSTAFERDLYSFDDLPEEMAQYLESVFLQRTDHLASQAMTKLLAGDRSPWTNDLRSAWSRFLVGFLIRHPDPFGELRQAAHDRWLKADPETEAEYQKIRLPEHPSTFEEYLKQAPGHLAARIRVRLLQGVLDNENLGNRINGMIWDVLDVSDSPHSLLTSDWPLDHNLRPANGLIGLPLSPTRLFVGVYEAGVLARLRKQRVRTVVHHMNRLTVSRARRFVYSADDSQSEFIEKWMSSAMVARPFYPSISCS